MVILNNIDDKNASYSVSLKIIITANFVSIYYMLVFVLNILHV